IYDVSAITGRYLSTDFVVCDSKGNIIHYTAKGTITHNFLLLKEGGIYSIKNFTVHPNKDDFRVVKHATFMLEFDRATAIRKTTITTFHCKVMIESVRSKKGWNYPSCGGGQCKKGATRQLGKWFCEACNKEIKYRLELGVTDDTTHVVVVLFDEPATKLGKCSAESLLTSSADEDSNLLAAITNLIGTTYVFELKSHTYYEYGTFKSFTCLKINPTAMVEEVASSTIIGENTENPSPEFKSLTRTPSVCTPSKGPEEKKNKRSEVEGSDADDDCGLSKKPAECDADVGTKKKKQKSGFRYSDDHDSE
nr:hypothetical protein [Tanacetum cinerariifolium]